MKTLQKKKMLTLVVAGTLLTFSKRRSDERICSENVVIDNEV